MVGLVVSPCWTLGHRVGIATGIVVVGDLIGSGEAQERGIVGETPNLAARLQAEGAHVRAYDPVSEANALIEMPQLDCAPTVAEVVRDADAIVLVTEWPELISLDWVEVAAAISPCESIATAPTVP